MNTQFPQSLRHPLGATSVRIFRSPSRAAEHIRKHLLGRRERFAWITVIETLSERFPPKDAALWNQADRAVASARGEEFEFLYDLYAEAIRDESLLADELRWVVQTPLLTGEARTAVLMASRGLLVVIDGDTVVTAFFPNQDVPEGGNIQDPSRESPRESYQRAFGMRSGRRRKKVRSPVSTEESAYRTRDERIYQEIFLPAIEFVRNSWRYAFDVQGNAQRHYHLLNEVLPTRTPKFADWRTLPRV